MIKHPFKTAFALGATVALAAAAPITVPIMVAAGLGLGAIQTAKGVTTAIREAARGNYYASEKAFGNIGEGAFSVVSSLLGVRQAGAIAAEAKASRLSLTAAASVKEKLTAVDQGVQASLKVQGGSYANAFKETWSVFSVEGLKTTGMQLNPTRLAALAKGKAESVISLFRENPVVDLNQSVQKAQRFLKLKDKDMPTIKPSLQLEEGGDLSRSVHGFYKPDSHSLHIDPHRQNAFRNRLSPTIRNQFDKLPESLQKLVGNFYKRSISVDEIVTHELTHARQFNRIATMTETQAQGLLRQKFPGASPEQISEVLGTLRFQGGGNPAAVREGGQYLTRFAEYAFNRQNLSEISLEQFLNPAGSSAALAKTRALAFKNYTRIGFEVEARQKAAEAAIAEAVGNLAKPNSLFQENQLLGKYKALKLEAKLNKLMGKINNLKGPNQPEAVRLAERQLNQLANLPVSGSHTRGYVKMENKLERQVRVLQNRDRLKQNVQNVQAGKTTVFQVVRTTVSRWVGWIYSGFKNLFTPSGAQRMEQRYQSLKPAYVALNHTVTRRSHQEIHYGQRSF